MKKMFCVGCQKEVESFAWKYKSYETKNGKKKDGWFCEKHFKATYHEWVPEYIKKDRVEYAKDIVQPFRSGEPSGEFAKIYPKKAKKIFTPKELSRAKPVWRDLKGLGKWQ